MSKIDYVMHEDGSDTLIMAESDWDFLDTEEILENYPYIFDSMENEGYYMENDFCSIFDKIIFENKVVGFATFELRSGAILLTECYILPEFRGNRLFFDEICKMICILPVFGILQPTRNIVELLLEFAFAKEITDDIIASAIPFYFDDIDAKSTKNRELDEDEMEPSHFYDLSINSTIFVDGDEVIYHDLLENDLRKQGSRKELTGDYFTGLIEFFGENDFDELVEELKGELPQMNLGFDEIVGHGEGLSEYMQGVVDQKIISLEKALEIKRILIEEYESGQIDDETIDDRFTSLVVQEMSDPIDMDFLEELQDSSEEYVDMQTMGEFFDMIGNNEDLASNILDAILSDDEEEFENLIIDAMNEDDEFKRSFLDLAERIDDGDDFPSFLDDDDFDFEALGLNMDSRYPVAEMMWGPNDDKYKLDDTFYGKDYPITHDIYLFRVLTSLKKHNNLPFALAMADMKGAATSQMIESFMFENDFISDEVTYDNWDEFANDELTIPDLKDILRKNGLKVSGRKQELIDRIAENQVPLDEFSSKKVRVTPAGEEFLKDNRWIRLYDDFLDKFDFNDYVKYLDENEGEFLEVTLKYLEAHLELANEMEDMEYIRCCGIAHNILSEIGEHYLSNLYGSD